MSARPNRGGFLVVGLARKQGEAGKLGQARDPRTLAPPHCRDFQAPRIEHSSSGKKPRP